MINFNEWTEEQREDTLSNHTTTTLLIDRITLGFAEIENEFNEQQLTQIFELPPTIVDKKILVKIMANTGTNNSDRWLRTMIRTYLEDGKVIYRKISQDVFQVTLKF